jgi:hypothetical protein
MLGTITSLYLPYIETVNYRHAQKAVLPKKKKAGKTDHEGGGLPFLQGILICAQK